MGVCKLGAYTDNKVVKHLPLFCIGDSHGQPKCEYIEQCLKEQGIEKPFTHTCLRCGKSWQSKIERPLCCRWCKNKYWDKPRIYKTYNCPTSR